ncbi:tetratricopeptide repeat protein [Verrucosispora sp. WMMD703]|uniref:tetratricopeptide repeat protein n=1 Tax=Verrucosispora sp. WMMD703 TaxID=3403463 RepID=UPI003B950E38
MAEHDSDLENFEQLLRRSSLGTPGARRLRQRTPATHVEAARKINHLRNRLAHSTARVDAAAAVIGLINCFGQLGYRGQAEDLLFEALPSPENAVVANMAASWLLERGRHEDAEGLYRRAAEYGDDTAEINLANLLVEQGRVEEAEALYRRAAASGDISALLNLASLLVLQEREEEAEALYRRAAESEKMYLSSDLDDRLVANRRYEVAQALYERAAETVERSAGTINRPAEESATSADNRPASE